MTLTASRGHGRRFAGALGCAALLFVTTAGCGGVREISSGGGARPSPAKPLGVIAIGHSGLTAEDSDPTHPGRPALENSWATGTAPAVDSVYRRLVAARPETEGHVASSAVGGAQVWTLEDQAAAALRSVPTPELVIVQAIDNDIRCDGTDPQNVGVFGASLQQTLESINESSPESKILVVGQLGRPSTSFVTELVAGDPGVKGYLIGSGICDFYTEQGELNASSFTTLTTIVESYEAEQARVCAVVAHCRTDGGVRAAYTDTIDNFTNDLNHLNVAGQASEAELIWPVVADFLGLS